MKDDLDPAARKFVDDHRRRGAIVDAIATPILVVCLVVLSIIGFVAKSCIYYEVGKAASGLTK